EGGAARPQARRLREWGATPYRAGAEPNRDVRVSSARRARLGPPGAVHPHARPARAGRDRVERRVVLARHLADGERRTAHLWHSARGGSLQRSARLQPRRRFTVRYATPPDPGRGARVA